MKGIILLANGFELAEATITIDLLRRSDIDIVTVSMYDDYYVKSSNNIIIKCDELVDDIYDDNYDFLVIPGGSAVYSFHLQQPITKKLISKFVENEKIIGAICAAPLILKKYGFLDGIKYTCFENNFDDPLYQPKKVVKFGNIITSKACGTSFDFALALIEVLHGSKQKKKIKKEIYYEFN